jgi:glycosyltransferase involved in cell wall biosynthesis
MASGLPVIASRVGGILECVEDGRSGLLVTPGDARQLADRICQLMGNPSLAARLGTSARTSAARFDFDRMIAAFDRLYVTELAQRGVVPATHAQLAAS